MSAEIEVVDDSNDEGEIFTRHWKLSDHFLQPYANEQAARFANVGAYPPDLVLLQRLGITFRTMFLPFSPAIMTHQLAYQFEKGYLPILISKAVP
ncbi:unnamed protein product [Victoria cruziana]